MDIFTNLYEAISSNGIVQIDDYGFWEGCRKAVDDFQAARQLDWPLRQIDETGAWFRKTRSDGFPYEVSSILMSLQRSREQSWGIGDGRADVKGPQAHGSEFDPTPLNGFFLLR